MKDTLLKPTFASRETLLRKWRAYSYFMGHEQTSKIIDKENKLLEEIEKLLPFQNQEEHDHWIEVGNSKFFNDFEELTLSIINGSNVPNNISKLLDAYSQVAMDVCQDANFYDLFKAFQELSHNWVNTMDAWSDWWEKISKNGEDASSFLETYKDIYGKDYKLEDVFKFYGFETSTHPMFYKNDVEGKSDLIDCIFERYIQGLEDDEELWFYQRLIKELI